MTEARLPNFARLFREAIAESVRDYLAANPHLLIAGLWLIARSKRHPLIPARTYWTDAEPGNPDNLLDRWPLPVLAGEIAGELADPLDIFGSPVRRAIESRDGLTADQEYRFQIENMRHARLYRPHEPIANPRRRVQLSQLPIPFLED